MKMNKNRTGCHDVFRAFLVKYAKYAGEHEIPCIKGTRSVPNKLIAFSKAMRAKDFNQWVHFFEDDYQFERLWNNPKKYLERLKKFNGVILPDFSLYRDMPLAMQIWNIYRSRAIGTWLQYNGVEVIVNARFGDERTYDVCCEGVDANSTIAVCSVGTIQDSTDREIFVEGVLYVIDKLTPTTLVVYGSVPEEIAKQCKINNIALVAFDGETKHYFSKEVV